MGLPGKGRFPSPKRCFPGEKRGFPSEKRYKTISSRDKTRFIKLGGWSKRMFSRRMSHDRQPPQKYAKNIHCPGLNPLAQGQFLLKRRDTRHLASRGISAFRSGIQCSRTVLCSAWQHNEVFPVPRTGLCLRPRAERGLFGFLPGTFTSNASRTPDTVVGAKTRLTRVVKLIPKVAAKDSKNKGLSVGGVTDPLQPARKTRFIRLWPLVWPRNADSRGAKALSPRQSVG